MDTIAECNGVQCDKVNDEVSVKDNKNDNANIITMSEIDRNDLIRTVDILHIDTATVE